MLKLFNVSTGWQDERRSVVEWFNGDMIAGAWYAAELCDCAALSTQIHDWCKISSLLRGLSIVLLLSLIS